MSRATRVPGFSAAEASSTSRAVAEELGRAELTQRSGCFRTLVPEVRALVDEHVRGAGGLRSALQRHVGMPRHVAEREREPAVVRREEPAVAVQERPPVHGRVEHRAQVEVGVAERQLGEHAARRLPRTPSA